MVLVQAKSDKLSGITAKVVRVFNVKRIQIIDTERQSNLSTCLKKIYG
jgi:hypothetical protein